jgi:hypothetical protein
LDKEYSLSRPLQTQETNMGSTTNTTRLQERKEFDETKAGVKGLVDKGILKIPTLFHHPPHNFSNSTISTNTQHTIYLL